MASEFAHYEHTLPGAADRMLTMAEEGQRAQIEDRRTETKAQAFALYFAVVAFSLLPYALIIVSLVLGIKGETWPATVTAIGGIVLAVAQFLKK